MTWSDGSGERQCGSLKRDHGLHRSRVQVQLVEDAPYKSAHMLGHRMGKVAERLVCTLAAPPLGP